MEVSVGQMMRALFLVGAYPVYGRGFAPGNTAGPSTLGLGGWLVQNPDVLW